MPERDDESLDRELLRTTIAWRVGRLEEAVERNQAIIATMEKSVNELVITQREASHARERTMRLYLAGLATLQTIGAVVTVLLVHH